MTLWAALAVPFLVAIVVGLLYHRKILLREYLIMLAAPAIIIAITAVTTEYSQVKDTEFWGGVVNQARYWEDWDEEVPCRHPIYCTDHKTCTDSQGHSYDCSTEYVCGHHHAYDVDYHPPSWDMNDSNGFEWNISKTKFEELSKRFGNNTFKELGRRYHANDGDLWFSDWWGERVTAEITSSSFSYENRVQASRSIFNFPKVDPTKNKLFEYPPINGWIQKCVLGDVGPGKAAGEEAIHWLNGSLGAHCEFRTFVLVFKNKPIEVGLEQQAYWKNGNMNELVIPIGVDNEYKPVWCFPFGWTKQETIKVEARNLVMEQPQLDVAKLGDWLFDRIYPPPASLTERVGARRIIMRRQFENDFKYISVYPPTWVVVMTFIITILVSIGVAWWAVTNEFEHDVKPRRW
jgi:hypothetical protein